MTSTAAASGESVASAISAGYAATQAGSQATQASTANSQAQANYASSSPICAANAASLADAIQTVINALGYSGFLSYFNPNYNAYYTCNYFNYYFSYAYYALPFYSFDFYGPPVFRYDNQILVNYTDQDGQHLVNDTVVNLKGVTKWNTLYTQGETTPGGAVDLLAQRTSSIYGRQFGEFGLKPETGFINPICLPNSRKSGIVLDSNGQFIFISPESQGLTLGYSVGPICYAADNKVYVNGDELLLTPKTDKDGGATWTAKAIQKGIGIICPGSPKLLMAGKYWLGIAADGITTVIIKKNLKDPLFA